MKKILLSRLTTLLPMLPALVSAADLQKAQNTTAINAAGAFTVISGTDADTIPDSDDRIIWNNAFTVGAGIVPRTAGTLSGLGGNTSVQGIVVSNVAGTANLATSAIGIQNPLSANTLTIGTGGIDMSAATQTLYLEPAIALSGSQTWAVTNANTAANPTGFGNGEDLAFRALAAASATTATTAFNFGGNTVTTSGTGAINISSGYNVTNGTLNIGNSLFIFSGGDSRAVIVGSDVTKNVASGATLHYQSNSGIITDNGPINLNGGTLKLVSNNATNLVTIGGAVTVNSASTLNVGNNVGNGSVAITTANAGLMLNGGLSGSGALNVTNNASTANLLILGGNNSGYSGTITLGATGSTAGRSSRISTANGGSAAATWNVASGHTLQLHGVNVTLGTLSGAGTVNNSLAATTSVLTSGAGTFSGTLVNGTGTLALTKTTGGTLALTGANTYTGTTQVNAGTLSTTPLQTGSTTVNVADSATFGVNLVTAGTTFATAALNSGTSGANTLLLGTGLLGNPTASVVNATSFVPQTGTVIKLTGTALSAGTGIPLVSYGTLGGGGFAGLGLSLPARHNGVLVDNSGASRIDLNITSVEQAKWRGNIDGNWDADTDGTGTNGTANWRTTVLLNSTKYLQGTGGTDVANFDNSADGNRSVNLTTTLTPVSVNVSGTGYTFGGSGKLSGAMPLAVSGGLTVANTTANDYTGGTTIASGGSVTLGNGVTSGAGVLPGAITNDGTLILNRPDDHNLANTITGTGAIQKDQANTVTVTASTTAGNVALNAGKLKFSGGGTLSGTLSGGGQLEVAGGTLQLSGSTANTNTGLTTVSSGTLQLNKTAGTDAIGGNISFTGTGGLGLLQTNQFADTATLTYDKAINGGTVTLGNETLAAITILNGHDSNAQIIGNNGLAVTGNITIGGTGVFATASNHTVNTGGVVLNGNTATLRTAGNSNPSTLNIGSSGITAAGGFIQVGQGTGAFDAVVNLGGNYTATGDVLVSDGTFLGTQKREVNLGADTRTFDIAAATTTTFEPDIAGTGGLTKAGDGTLRFTTRSISTYTGATSIDAGTLALQGSAALSGTPSIIVKAGATFDVSAVTGGFTLGATQTLGGKGTVLGGVVTSAGSKWAPGESPGTITVNGNLDLTNAVTSSASGALVYELDTPGTSDQTLLNGANVLTIGSGVLEFDDFAFTALGGFAEGTYVLFDTSTSITGALGSNLTGTVGGLPATLSLADGTNDLVLTVVPEPGSAVLGLAGLALLTRRRRK